MNQKHRKVGAPKESVKRAGRHAGYAWVRLYCLSLEPVRCLDTVYE
jgi:hypothetical protein